MLGLFKNILHFYCIAFSNPKICFMCYKPTGFANGYSVVSSHIGLVVCKICSTSHSRPFHWQSQSWGCFVFVLLVQIWNCSCAVMGKKDIYCEYLPKPAGIPRKHNKETSCGTLIYCNNQTRCGVI